MAFTTLGDDLKIITKLEDEPNDVGGLTAAELKAKFDEAGGIIQKFINEVLLPELENGDGAGRLGAWLNGEESSVQKSIDYLASAAAKNGNIPTGGHAGQALVKQSDGVYDARWQELFTTVDFAAADWAEGEGGEYVMTVPRSVHKRTGDTLSCLVRHLLDGALVDNTWAVAGTRSKYDGDSGDVVLVSKDAYAGSVTLFG